MAAPDAPRTAPAGLYRRGRWIDRPGRAARVVVGVGVCHWLASARRLVADPIDPREKGQVKSIGLVVVHRCRSAIRRSSTSSK